MTVTVKLRPYQYSHTIGMLALTGKGFSNPVDIALGGKGVAFVINRSNAFQAPQGAVRVTVVNYLEQEYLRQFGGFGTDEGQFIWPTSIAIDSKGNVYVADEHRHDVQVFDNDGNYLRKIGEEGSGVGQLDRPSGLAVDSKDNLYVVDHMNNRIQVFDPSGKSIRTFGSAGSGPGEFNLPWGIAIDDQDQVFVADWRNDRIQKFTSDGKYLATIGSSGSGAGQLNRPANLDIDKDGNLVVCDWGNERVSVFSSLGFPITTIIGDSEMSKWGAEFLAANQDLTYGRKIMADGTPEKRFFGPLATAVDEEGRLVVVDSCRHRLQIYNRG